MILSQDKVADFFQGTWPTTALLRITAQHKDPQCSSFLAHSSILPVVEFQILFDMVASNTAFNLKISILNSHIRRASVRHAPAKSAKIMS